MITEINKLRTINKLKGVYRITSVGARRESSAEHSWSCIVLADYFMNKMNLELDRLKVYELLLYHDLVEVETEDFPLNNEEKRKNKKNLELEAAKHFKQDLPKEIGEKFWHLFEEFEEMKTPEAKFAKAVDYMDAIVQEIDYKEDWRGWTAEFLIRKKAHLFEEYPAMKILFKDILELFEKEGYFTQE